MSELTTLAIVGERPGYSNPFPEYEMASVQEGPIFLWNNKETGILNKHSHFLWEE